MVNILSFDIEEWFHPEILADRFPMKIWNGLEPRVERNTDVILNFLSRKNLKATFFFLGWVAEKYPQLVKRTCQEGHEIACHGYAHNMITKMSEEEFRKDLQKSLGILNSLSDSPVRGFRAPTFSLTEKTKWAVPIMFEEGIRFDSSIFPIHHDRYGIPDAPRKPFVLYSQGAEKIVEYPMTTIKVGTYNLPFGGGGYFRLYPLKLTLGLMNKRQKEKNPVIFYAHPWEFDTDLPDVPLGFFGKIRHYAGIHKFLQRLEIIAEMFPFTSFKEASLINGSEAAL